MREMQERLRQRLSVRKGEVKMNSGRPDMREGEVKEQVIN
jgi:hypothetical protein